MFLFAGSFSTKPKKYLKSLSPVSPPVSRIVELIRVASATASACVRIAKYAPFTRRLNSA